MTTKKNTPAKKKATTEEVEIESTLDAEETVEAVGEILNSIIEDAGGRGSTNPFDPIQ